MNHTRLPNKTIKSGLLQEFPWLQVVSIKRDGKKVIIEAAAPDGVSYAPLPSYWDEGKPGFFQHGNYYLHIAGYNPSHERKKVVVLIDWEQYTLSPDICRARIGTELPFQVKDASWTVDYLDTVRELLLTYNAAVAEFPEWQDPEWDIRWPYE